MGEKTVETRERPDRAKSVHEHQHGIEPGVATSSGSRHIRLKPHPASQANRRARLTTRLRQPAAPAPGGRGCAAPRRLRDPARDPDTDRERSARSRAADPPLGRRNRPATKRLRPDCPGAGGRPWSRRPHRRGGRSRRGQAVELDRDRQPARTGRLAREGKRLCYPSGTSALAAARASRPRTHIDLVRPLWPERISTAERGSRSRRARNRTTSRVRGAVHGRGGDPDPESVAVDPRDFRPSGPRLHANSQEPAPRSFRVPGQRHLTASNTVRHALQ